LRSRKKKELQNLRKKLPRNHKRKQPQSLRKKLRQHHKKRAKQRQHRPPNLFPLETQLPNRLSGGWATITNRSKPCCPIGSIPRQAYSYCWRLLTENVFSIDKRKRFLYAIGTVQAPFVYVAHRLLSVSENFFVAIEYCARNLVGSQCLFL